MRNAEKGLLEWALKEAEGEPLVAAARLGISRTFMYRRLRVLRIPYLQPNGVVALARRDVALARMLARPVSLARTDVDNTPEPDDVDDVASENAYEPTISNQD